MKDFVSNIIGIIFLICTIASGQDRHPTVANGNGQYPSIHVLICSKPEDCFSCLSNISFFEEYVHRYHPDFSIDIILRTRSEIRAKKYRDTYHIQSTVRADPDDRYFKNHASIQTPFILFTDSTGRTSKPLPLRDVLVPEIIEKEIRRLYSLLSHGTSKERHHVRFNLQGPLRRIQFRTGNIPDSYVLPMFTGYDEYMKSFMVYDLRERMVHVYDSSGSCTYTVELSNLPGNVTIGPNSLSDIVPISRHGKIVLFVNDLTSTTKGKYLVVIDIVMHAIRSIRLEDCAYGNILGITGHIRYSFKNDVLYIGTGVPFTYSDHHIAPKYPVISYDMNGRCRAGIGHGICIPEGCWFPSFMYSPIFDVNPYGALCVTGTISDSACIYDSNGRAVMKFAFGRTYAGPYRFLQPSDRSDMGKLGEWQKSLSINTRVIFLNSRFVALVYNARTDRKSLPKCILLLYDIDLKRRVFERIIPGDIVSMNSSLQMFVEDEQSESTAVFEYRLTPSK